MAWIKLLDFGNSVSNCNDVEFNFLFISIVTHIFEDRKGNRTSEGIDELFTNELQNRSSSQLLYKSRATQRCFNKTR